MYTINDIIELIEQQTGADVVGETDDIVNDLGCDGDDFDDLINVYTQRFHVDMTTYLWYFHHVEEGSWNSIGSGFFKPPNERVQRIPITPKMLLEFANSGKWMIDYPAHTLPKRRYDLFINQALLVVFIIYALYSCFKK